MAQDNNYEKIQGEYGNIIISTQKNIEGIIRLINTFDINFKLNYDQRKALLQFLEHLKSYKTLLDEFSNRIVNIRLKIKNNDNSYLNNPELAEEMIKLQEEVLAKSIDILKEAESLIALISSIIDEQIKNLEEVKQEIESGQKILKEERAAWQDMCINLEPNTSVPRILMITYQIGFEIGGLGTQSLLIYKNLKSNGFTIDALETSPYLGGLILHRNGKYCGFKSYDEFIQAINPKLYNIIYFQWYPEGTNIRELLIKLKHHFNEAKIIYVVRNDSREALRYTEPSPENITYVHLKFDIEAQDILIEQADLIVHLAPPVLKKFTEQYHPTIKDNSIIISDAVELPKSSFLKEAEKDLSGILYKKNIVLLHLGRLVEEKGTFKLAQAYNYIYKTSDKKNFYFIFAGNSNIPNYQQIITQLMPDVPKNRIKFTGLVNLNAKSYYYQIADLLILPTYREMLANVALESIISGTPVLLTRLTNMDDTCYKRGITVPIGLIADKVPETEDIIKSLEWSIANISSLKKRANYFREHFKKVYSFDNFSRKMKLVFEALNNGRDIEFIKNMCERLEEQDSKSLSKLQPINLEKEYQTPIYDVDVSYIIAVYNSEKFIIDTINSLLNQKFNGTYNLLIVDDQSTDNSINLIRQEFSKEIEKDKIIILHNKWKIVGQTYQGAARNYAFYKIDTGFAGKYIRPKYISHFDSDDIAFPARTQILFEYIEKSKSDMVCARAITIDEFNRPTLRQTIFYWDCERLSLICGMRNSWKENVLRTIDIDSSDCWKIVERLFSADLPQFKENINKAVLKGSETGCSYVHNQTTMVKIEAMYKTGHQKDTPGKPGIEDYYFWLRMAELGLRMDFINKSVAFYRYGKDRDLKFAKHFYEQSDYRSAYNYYFNYIREFLRDYKITKTVPHTSLINKDMLNLEKVKEALYRIIELANKTNNPQYLEQLADFFKRLGYDKQYKNLADIVFDAIAKTKAEEPLKTPPNEEKVVYPEIVITQPDDPHGRKPFNRGQPIEIRAVINNYTISPDFTYKLKVLKKINGREEEYPEEFEVDNSSIKVIINASWFRVGTHKIFLRLLNIYPGTSKPHLDSNIITISISEEVIHSNREEWERIRAMPRNNEDEFKDFLRRLQRRKWIAENPDIELIEEVLSVIIDTLRRLIDTNPNFKRYKEISQAIRDLMTVETSRIQREVINEAERDRQMRELMRRIENIRRNTERAFRDLIMTITTLRANIIGVFHTDMVKDMSIEKLYRDIIATFVIYFDRFGYTTIELERDITAIVYRLRNEIRTLAA